MKSFQGLLKKDLRISRSEFLICLVLLLIAMGAAIWLTIYTKQPAVTLPLLIFTGFALMFFSPIMMLSFLRKEGKTQLWLYSPRASHTLVFSKFCVTLFYQIILQLLLTIFAVLSVFYFGKIAFEAIGVDVFTDAMLLIHLTIIVMGLFFSCWILFLWSVYHSLQRYPAIKSIRWLFIVLIYIGYNILEAYLIHLEAVKEFVFSYSVELITFPALELVEQNWTVQLDPVSIPVIPALYYIMLTLLLFTSSIFLLERKVEV